MTGELQKLCAWLGQLDLLWSAWDFILTNSRASASVAITAGRRIIVVMGAMYRNRFILSICSELSANRSSCTLASTSCRGEKLLTDSNSMPDLVVEICCLLQRVITLVTIMQEPYIWPRKVCHKERPWRFYTCMTDLKARPQVADSAAANPNEWNSGSPPEAIITPARPAGNSLRIQTSHLDYSWWKIRLMLIDLAVPDFELSLQVSYQRQLELVLYRL